MADVPEDVLHAARREGAEAAQLLASVGHARIDLCPGDATQYRLALIWLPDRTDDLVVAVLGYGSTELPTRYADGTPQQWNPLYLEGKLLLRSGGWSGAVVAAFLDGLLANLPAR